MESNLKRVIADLNKSRGLSDGSSSAGNGTSTGAGAEEEGANPIAKVTTNN